MLWNGTECFSPGQTEGANQPEEGRDFFFFFKQCSSSTPRSSFSTSQQTTSQSPFSSPMGKALQNTVPCDAALERGKQGRDGAAEHMHVTSAWPLCLHTRWPLRDESVPPAPRRYSAGCLHMHSWKLPLSLAESTCRRRRRAGSTRLQGRGFRSSPVVRHHLSWLHLGSKVAGASESKL